MHRLRKSWKPKLRKQDPCHRLGQQYGEGEFCVNGKTGNLSDGESPNRMQADDQPNSRSVYAPPLGERVYNVCSGNPGFYCNVNKLTNLGSEDKLKKRNHQ